MTLDVVSTSNYSHKLAPVDLDQMIDYTTDHKSTDSKHHIETNNESPDAREKVEDHALL